MIGSLFYTTFITGAYTVNSNDEVINMAKEVINALPVQERCIFAVIHQYQGERLVYGYYYGGKAYGTIQVYQANNIYAHVDIVNKEYIVR